MNELQVVEYDNQRVLLTSQLAESYGTTNKVISNNFNNNKERYKAGKHYICLTGTELKEFKSKSLNLGIANNINTLYLWTERGAFLHAKSLNTDRAWEVYDSLVEHYFKSKENSVKSLPSNYKEALLELVAQIEENEKLQLENQQQKKEIEYKEDIIIGLVDDISVADKRQILNRVVRRGGAKKIKDRWNALYREFDNKYHIDVSRRWENYNENHKPKIKNKLDYIDKVMDKVPELYDIAVKLYENDVKELVQEMYELNNIKNEVATYGN